MKKITVITSLNSWDDIRIYTKEVVSLKKKYRINLFATESRTNNKIPTDINIFIHQRPRNFLSRIKLLFKLLIKTLKIKTDFYHFHNPELLLIVPFIKSRYKSRKIIFDMHEDFEQAILDREWIPVVLRKPMSIIYKKYLNYLIKNKKLDHVIVTTPLIRKKFNYQNITIIENYAPYYQNIIETQIPSEIRIKINQDSNFKIIFTGLINEQRGVINIIEAIKDLEDVSLYLIGIYSKDLFERISKTYNELLGSKIYIFESIKYEEMLSVFRYMDVGIIPYLPLRNHVVTRPNKLFEYMLMGLPVIASDFPLYKDILDKGCGLTFDPTNIESIREKIVFLKNHREVGEEMGKKGKELYLNKYNWKIEEKKLFNIYQSLQ